MIQTVLGRVLPETLWHFQPHEHLFVHPTPASKKSPALEISSEEKSLAELLEYRQKGGGAIADAQPLGAGRDARVLRELSRKSGVSIVAVTGYHVDMFYREGDPLPSLGEEALYERFSRELREGCEECVEVLPGAVKAAIGPAGSLDKFRARLRAAARAAADAGTALILHTQAGEDAVDAVRICGDCALAPERILVCHVDRQAEDFSVHEAVAKTGAYLEYDTIGRFKYHDDPSEIRLILHMLERGYGDKLLLALDTTAARLQSYGGEIGLTYLLERFLPALRRQGVSEEEIAQMTRRNPAKALRLET